MQKRVTTAARVVAACAFMVVYPSASANESADWASMTLGTINENPQLQAQQRAVSANRYGRKAASRPLFNPELQTSLEREGEETNYQIGLSSQIDWWDVKQTRTDVAEAQFSLAEAELSALTNQLLARLVDAQLNGYLARKALALASEQVSRDYAMLSLSERQLAAGEIAQTDVAIAKAILADSLVWEGEASFAVLQAEQTLEQLGAGDMGFPAIPDAVWQDEPALLPVSDIMALPQSQVARFSWLVAKQQAANERQGNKPVPVIGLGAGKQAGEGLVSLNVSVPLQWRNDFSDANAAANEQALSAELMFKNTLQAQQSAVSLAYRNALQHRQRFQRWQQLSAGQLDQQFSVLQSRYAQGDLSMAAYQNQITQLRQGKRAALALEAAFKESHLTWLQVTATLPSLLTAMPAHKPGAEGTR